jgi:DNA-binding LacI/PurR family transcriptional regulator
MLKMRKTTIKGVAAAAGVSVTTVSDALSGKGRLPDATREKVQAIANQLGYRPSAIARGLRGSGIGLVGICIAPAGGGGVLTDVSYWAAIVTHASQAFLSDGHAAVLLPHDVGLLETLHIPLDGVIVVDPLERDPVLTFFEDRNIRCLTIGRDVSKTESIWVDDDTATGVRRLIEATISPGTKLAFLRVGPIKSYVTDAISGARSWAADGGGTLSIHQCAGLESEHVAHTVREAVHEGATAILTQNDRLALRVRDVLQAMGRDVPGDVRLLSAADAMELGQGPVGISAARPHPARLAEMAAAKLLDMIRGQPDVASTMSPMEVSIRESAPLL